MKETATNYGFEMVKSTSIDTVDYDKSNRSFHNNLDRLRRIQSFLKHFTV